MRAKGSTAPLARAAGDLRRELTMLPGALFFLLRWPKKISSFFSHEQKRKAKATFMYGAIPHAAGRPAGRGVMTAAMVATAVVAATALLLVATQTVRAPLLLLCRDVHTCPAAGLSRKSEGGRRQPLPRLPLLPRLYLAHSQGSC